MLELFAMVLIGAGWLVPDHYPPWMSAYNDSCVALGLLLLVAATWRSWPQAASSKVAWIVCAVAAIPALQWAGGRLAFSGDAWISAVYLFGFGVAMFAGRAWASQGPARSAAMLAGCILAASVVSALLAIAQALGVEAQNVLVNNRTGDRAVANLGQPNNLGTLLGLGALGLLLLREQGKLGRAASLAIAAVLLVGIAATRSRTALLFGPVVLVGMTLAIARGVPLQTTRWAVAAWAVAHWCLILVWPAAQEVVFPDGGTTLPQLGLQTKRLEMWPVLIDALSTSPWLGFGWLQTGAAQLSAVDRHPPVFELWMHGHNLFLDLLIYAGYPIGVLLSALIVYWFGSRWLSVRRPEAVVGMLMVSVVGTHAMLELPHHYAYFLIPVGLWIGLVELEASASSARRSHLPMAVAMFAAAMLVATWWKYPEVEEDFRLARFEHRRIGSIKAERPAPDAPLLSSLTAFLEFTRTKPVPGMSAESLARMEAVTMRYPYAASLTRMASAWALNGRLDDARSLFAKIEPIYGRPMYLKLRQELKDSISEGNTGLSPLLDALPH
jgi:hypothetical protein